MSVWAANSCLPVENHRVRVRCPLRGQAQSPEGQAHRHCHHPHLIRRLRRVWVECMTESIMTTNQRASEVPRHTITSVLSGVTVQYMKVLAEMQMGEGMIRVVPGVDTRVSQEQGQGSSTLMLISNTRVVRTTPEEVTSLLRHSLERRTILIRTPRPIPRYMDTHPVRHSIHLTRVHKRIKMVNNTMAGILIHSKPRQIMRMDHQQARIRTPRHLIIHSKDNTPLQLAPNTLDQHTLDLMHDMMSVPIRTPM